MTDDPYRTAGTSSLTADERIAAAAKRRDGLRNAFTAALREQQASDDEAITDLEASMGFGRVLRISIAGCWKPGIGAPTAIAVEVPTGSSKLAQRFIQQINRAKEGSLERLTAQDSLSTECWLYPPKGSDGHKAALEIAPLILSNAALQLVKASQGVAEEEGKG